MSKAKAGVEVVLLLRVPWLRFKSDCSDYAWWLCRDAIRENCMNQKDAASEELLCNRSFIESMHFAAAFICFAETASPDTDKELLLETVNLQLALHGYEPFT